MFSFDKNTWSRKMMDMPFDRPGGNSPREAMEVSGNCVKSKEREGPNDSGFPKYHGRVLTFDKDKDEVEILSHNDKFSKHFIWCGSISEYFEIWNCD